jgi:hypothetical protein
METKRILTTLEERRRWEARRAELKKEMRVLPQRERMLRKTELGKIDQQISYYDSLLRQMKAELRPADRSSILSKG